MRAWRSDSVERCQRSGGSLILPVRTILFFWLIAGYSDTPGNDTDTVIGFSADDYIVFTYFDPTVNTLDTSYTDINNNGILDTVLQVTDSSVGETSTVDVLDITVDASHILAIHDDPFMY